MRSPKSHGFTLIELLIVVAIIAILAAIAVPNFLEAQTRSKVSRVRADLRSLTVAIESYRVDHNDYPEGTDNPNLYPQEVRTFLGPLAPGYYTFRTIVSGTTTIGTRLANVTTPVAYISSIPLDPFAQQLGGNLTYCYRNAKATKNGFILTSFGPDADALAVNGRGTQSNNPLSTFRDTNNPARLGDINERHVVHHMESTLPAMSLEVQTNYGSLLRALEDLSYDPTNGTISDGDIYRIGP